MTVTSLIITADRGSLKAYRVNQTPTRGAHLELMQSIDITDAHGRYADKLTGQAGRFPVSAGGAGHANAIGEHTALESENDRRIHKQLADYIREVVERENPESRLFAAPASIHSAIVELLPEEIRSRIGEHVKSDLVKIEPAKLLSHFKSLEVK